MVRKPELPSLYFEVSVPLPYPVGLAAMLELGLELDAKAAISAVKSFEGAPVGIASAVVHEGVSVTVIVDCNTVVTVT